MNQRVEVLRTVRSDHNVICKHPWNGVLGLDHIDPRLEEEGKHEHGQWAALRNTTRMLVRIANMPTN